MNHLDQINELLRLCTPAEQEQVLRQLRAKFPIHPLENQLNAKAEIILEAISMAGELTLRMMRGVIGEAAFRVEVVERLQGWQEIPKSGNRAYDFHLRDQGGDVRVQVKLQRSKKGSPWPANQACRAFRGLPPEMFVVETQKTRGGKVKKTGSPTRPYRFGEFDVLAVSMYPSTHQWDKFMYTVGDWLIPAPKKAGEIFRYQPVANAPNEDWTDSFQQVVAWFRSGTKKTIRAE